MLHAFQPRRFDDRANAVAGVAEMLLSKAAAWGFSDIASWYEPPAAEPTEAERQRSAMQRLLDRLTAASTQACSGAEGAPPCGGCPDARLDTRAAQPAVWEVPRGNTRCGS